MGTSEKSKWVVSATWVSSCLLFLFFVIFLFSQTIDLTAPLRATHQTFQDSFTRDDSVSNPPSQDDTRLNSSPTDEKNQVFNISNPRRPQRPPPPPSSDMNQVINISRQPNHQIYPRVDPHPISCPTNMTITCPANYPPPKPGPDPKSLSTCPDYFRWIHEDLKPWKKNGITREMVEDTEKQPDHFRSFRLVIVNGTAYVKQYAKCYQTRDVFTLWGILQLLKMYPGQIPDSDLMFQCNDVPSVKKTEFQVAEKAPPLFHYCGSDDTYDIVFPDWSFWGWPEINIKPWVPLKKDLEQGNMLMNWTDREPFAYWRGNTYMGERKILDACNSREKWNADIHHQDWDKEIREGFKSSDMSKQCKHRYKIYMEGIAWSVSEKYILACDSMTLLVNPIFYDIFTRSLIPLIHFWPINPQKICESVKFAVDWGNHSPKRAQEIGKTGSRFVQEDIPMSNVYDYMFHLLTEYGKLLAYKPTVPDGAVELCSDKWVCPATGDLEKKFKIETVVEAGGEPCRLPPSFEERELRNLIKLKKQNIDKVGRWTSEGKLEVL